MKDCIIGYTSWSCWKRFSINNLTKPIGPFSSKEEALRLAQTNADYPIILTTVNHAELNFGKPNHQILEKITVLETKKYLELVGFTKESMKPKIEVAVNFINKTNNKAIINSLNNLNNALDKIIVR